MTVPIGRSTPSHGPIQEPYDAGVTRNHTTATGLERGRQRGARPPYAAGLRRAAAAGEELHAQGTRRAYAANHGAHSRGLSAVDRRRPGRVAKPRALLRGGGPRNAADPGGDGARPRPSKTRRRGAAGFARRGDDN